ncbi:MAG: VacB/RNase II family 3'-5' exoribonuclease, partial [Bacteroidetes bacterium]|nr:VacB/RNase II family 3'-5' exoribonuclease [Bacteroidota bacterium]
NPAHTPSTEEKPKDAKPIIKRTDYSLEEIQSLLGSLDRVVSTHKAEQSGIDPKNMVKTVRGGKTVWITKDEMNAILINNGFSLKFAKSILREAKELPTKIPASELRARRDFRNITTFTIDPKDAKDFDDALSFEELSKNTWRIGIHIADVSHFVKQGSRLDEEALKRGTSVYLVDRVSPMLPEKLSNEICSLREGEEKACFAVVVDMNEKGEVLKEWIGRTVIKSDKRFTYEDAQKIIDSGKGNFSAELTILNKVAVILKKKRLREGAIAFETLETGFELDSDGVPIGIYVKERSAANFLIEEFMLLANKRVAEWIYKKQGKKINLPFVYRVHDYPDLAKLEDFARFALIFGYKINVHDTKKLPGNMNALMKKVEGKPEQNIIENMAIRTMSKAQYSTDNIGHYGLGFKHYTHFTSPIRRYSDVLVHRLLEKYLKGEQGGDVYKLEKQCEHISIMERKAMDAERDSIKYKQVEYIESHRGKTFEGVISGVKNWGFYVELVENKCEGLVRIDSIGDDFYTYDERNFSIVGRTHRKRYRLGDKVFVIISDTSMTDKTIDMMVVEDA